MSSAERNFVHITAPFDDPSLFPTFPNVSTDEMAMAGDDIIPVCYKCTKNVEHLWQKMNRNKW